MTPLAKRMAVLPQVGRVIWIGVRPGRGEPMAPCQEAQLTAGEGIVGDHFHSQRNSPRQITLMQAEHLPVIAACCGLNEVAPSQLRRNLLVAGINLTALKNRTFRVGSVLLQGTGPCAPCGKMEQALGPGGFNAMRGHGGLCARILSSGTIHLNDDVIAAPLSELGDPPSSC